MPDYATTQGTPIVMEFLGSRVDCLSLGIAHIGVQRIADKVARNMLAAEGAVAPRPRGTGYPYPWLRPRHPAIVQLEVTQASAGSYHSALRIAVLSILAQPHTLAILDGLAANVVWAIATSGLRGITSKLQAQSPIRPLPAKPEDDPRQVHSLVTDIIAAAGQNQHIEAIRFRAAESEVTLDIEFYRGRTEQS